MKLMVKVVIVYMVLQVAPNLLGSWMQTVHITDQEIFMFLGKVGFTILGFGLLKFTEFAFKRNVLRQLDPIKRQQAVQGFWFMVVMLIVCSGMIYYSGMEMIYVATITD